VQHTKILGRQKEAGLVEDRSAAISVGLPLSPALGRGYCRGALLTRKIAIRRVAAKPCAMTRTSL